VEKEKKNSESVKSKLTQKERELKHLKKEKSLKREMGAEYEIEKGREEGNGDRNEK
jgi:hypothetical protein